MSSFEGAFQAHWQQLLDEAVAGEGLFESGFGKSLAELLRAIEPTDLGRFMPFTSVNQFCLATFNWRWGEGKPAVVEFYPDRFRVRYRVISGYPDEKAAVALETNDPVAATHELVRLVESAKFKGRSSAERSNEQHEGQRIREMALRDKMTGLRSRPFVDNELPRILGTAVDEGTNLEVGLLDIDHFKLVNNNGHWFGDQVLVQLGQLLGEAAAPDSLAARTGGDEFLLVLTGDHIPERFEALRKRVESHPWGRIASGLAVTVSTGAIRLRPGRQTQAALLEQAERFLHAAKSAGGNRVVLDPD